MRIAYLLVKDFFNIALATWLLLLVLELLRAGMVQRFINLEYGFYGLLAVFIVLRIMHK